MRLVKNKNDGTVYEFISDCGILTKGKPARGVMLRTTGLATPYKLFAIGEAFFRKNFEEHRVFTRKEMENRIKC